MSTRKIISLSKKKTKKHLTCYLVYRFSQSENSRHKGVIVRRETSGIVFQRLAPTPPHLPPTPTSHRTPPVRGRAYPGPDLPCILWRLSGMRWVKIGRAWAGLSGEGETGARERESPSEILQLSPKLFRKCHTFF